MGIMRVAKNNNYTVMNRTALNDIRLSWKAKGIIAYMLSMPDDWVFYMDELMTHATDGKDSFRSGFRELKDNGYVERRAIKDENTKRIIEWETVVHEIPFEPHTDFPYVEKPDMEKPQVEKPDMENPPLLSTDINQVLNKPNTNELNTNQSITGNDFARVIDFYEKNISLVRPITGEKLGGLIDDFSADLVLYALEITALQPKVSSPIDYATKILIKWQENLVTTRQQAEIYQSNKRGEKNGTINQTTPKEYSDGVNF